MNTYDVIITVKTDDIEKFEEIVRSAIYYVPYNYSISVVDTIPTHCIRCGNETEGVDDTMCSYCCHVANK